MLWRPTTRRSAASGTRRLQVSPAVLCARSLPALDRSGLRPLRSSAAQPLWFSGIGLRPVRRSVVLALGSDLPAARVLRRSGALVFGRFGPHLLGCSSACPVWTSAAPALYILLLRCFFSPVRRSASPAPLRTSTVFLGSYSLACLRVCFLACLPACLLRCVCVCSDITHRCSNTSARCTRLGPFAAVFRRSGPRPLWSSAAAVLHRSGPRSLRSSAAPILSRSSFCRPDAYRASSCARPPLSSPASVFAPPTLTPRPFLHSATLSCAMGQLLRSTPPRLRPSALNYHCAWPLLRLTSQFLRLDCS